MLLFLRRCVLGGENGTADEEHGVTKDRRYYYESAFDVREMPSLACLTAATAVVLGDNIRQFKPGGRLSP
jgi:hypothetical protein